MDFSVVVSVSASIANLGPGFDVFAMALEEPVDVVEASPSEDLLLSEIVGRGADRIPRDPTRNAVTLAARQALDMMDRGQGLEVRIRKGIEPERGLGSSGASAVAGAIAANEVYGGKLSESQLVEAAAYSEGEIAGFPHYDNVVASLLGGFVVIGSFRPLGYVSLDPPPMKLVVVLPDMGAPTGEGREMLPEKVPLRESVANVGRASSMAIALEEGDLNMLGKYMVDSVVEPIRASKIPNLDGVKEAALEAGALGAAMAGAGPSVFAILDPESDVAKVKRAMKEAFEAGGLKSEAFETRPGSSPRIERGG